MVPKWLLNGEFWNKQEEEVTKNGLFSELQNGNHFGIMKRPPI